MKLITLKEATDEQIVDFIYDNPQQWEIEDFIGPYDYDYEITRGEDDIVVTLFGVSYIEQYEDEVSPLSPRDFIFVFTPLDIEIEVE